MSEKTIVELEELAKRMWREDRETDDAYDLVLQAAKDLRYLRAGLREIRDVALVSDGVEFYSMLADKYLEGEAHHEHEIR